MVGLLISLSLIKATRVVEECKWPPEWDILRDMGIAQVILEGRYPEDPILLGETLWFNPLTGALLAATHLMTGLALSRLGTAMGPWLNLITPVAFIFFVARFLGRGPALAGLCFLLYGKNPLVPFWTQFSYSPWLMAVTYAPGLMFLTLTCFLIAYQHKSCITYVVTGTLLGFTFLAHTAPAIIAGGGMLAFILYETLKTYWNSFGKKVNTSAVFRETLPHLGSFVLVLLAAFLVSLPYTYPIIVKYQFRILNPYPSLFTITLMQLDQLPERVREALNWSNALALVGIVKLVRKRTPAALLILCLGSTALLMLGYHYVLQWLVNHYGILWTGLAPGHHWALYVSVIKTILFGVGAAYVGELIVTPLSKKHLLGSKSNSCLHMLNPSTWAFLTCCIAGIAIYMKHPLTTRPDYQPPQRMLYQQYHEQGIPIYRWLLENSDPQSIVLCFEDKLAMTIVMPAARKLLFPMLIYSNIYVALGPLGDNNGRIVGALEKEDEEAFCDEMRRYAEVYLLMRRGDTHLSETIIQRFFMPVIENHSMVLYKAISSLCSS